MTVSVIIPTLDPTGPLPTQCQAALADEDIDLHVVHDTNRDGFVTTCHRGAEQATGDILIFLNDDTVPQPGWLRALAAHVDEDTIAGPRLVYPDGRIQHSGIFLRRRGPVLEAYNRQTDSPTGEVPAVTGACLAITRATWDRLGWFDTRYRNGYEDVDLCLRHREAGGRVVYVAESTVVHLESQSPGRFTHAQHNIALLQERWGNLPI